MFNIYTPPKENLTIEYILDRQYQKLDEEFYHRIPEFQINGSALYVPLGEKKHFCNSENDTRSKDYFENFLHLCSTENGFNTNIVCRNTLPYNIEQPNTASSEYLDCINSSYSFVTHDKIRHLCLYRACRVHWIPKIINGVNNNEEHIYSYEDPLTGDLYYIYYYEKTAKYSRPTLYKIIFSKDRQRYIFKTAYPVTEQSEVYKIIRQIKKIC